MVAGVAIVGFLVLFGLFVGTGSVEVLLVLVGFTVLAVTVGQFSAQKQTKQDYSDIIAEGIRKAMKEGKK